MLTSYLLWYNYDVCKNPKYKRKLFGFFIALINLFGGYYEIKEKSSTYIECFLDAIFSKCLCT